MSLNGLDSPEVQDAHQTAVGEAAGWFLLKYVSRDAVDLLGRGKNGVAEARNAIAGYTDASPLYGLIMYRRRKILIKYVPEGTSRLLQARTTVHLSDVLERYSPYEVLLEISTSDALNDTSLAASFPLHTASPSPSASRLDEIREDGEDSGPVNGDASSARKSMASLSAAQRYKAERRAEQLKRKVERAERPSSVLRAGEVPLVRPPRSPPARNAAVPEHRSSIVPIFAREEFSSPTIARMESPHHGSSTTDDVRSEISIKSDESMRKPGDIPDSASQTTQDTTESTDLTEVSRPAEKAVSNQAQSINIRDRELAPRPDEPQESSTGVMGDNSNKSSIDDPYDLSKYDEWFKPKVKLGPRPVAAMDKKRPTVPRVSALPANFKPAMKKQEPPQPQPSSPTQPASLASLPGSTPMPVPERTSIHRPLPASFVPVMPPVPPVPEYDPRPVSRGSIKSAPSHRSAMMTPDKLRLMKAIEYRKRQLRKSREQQSMKPLEEEAPEVPKLPQDGPVSNSHSHENEPEQHTSDEEKQPQSAKADSGIGMQYDKSDHQRTENSNLQSDAFAPPIATSQDPVMSQVLSGTSEVLSSTSLVLSGTSEVEASDQPAGKDFEDPVDNTSLDARSEAVSSSESQTPTEPASNAQQAAIPTITMADGSRPITSNGSAQEAPAPNHKNDNFAEKELSRASSTETLEAPREPRRQNSDLAKRRRGFVEPLEIDVNSGNPDDFASDDDDFLEELQSATVLEAKPITVSRSSLATSFPIRRTSAETLNSVKSVNIVRSGTSPSENAARSPDQHSPDPSGEISPTTLTQPDKADPMSGLSRNVSSGISRRIQALAENSSRESSPGINLTPSRPLSPETNPSAFLQDQRDRKSAAPRPRPTSFKRLSSHRGAQHAASVSPAASENVPVWSVQHDPATNRNSVSVTARIVRPSAADQTQREGMPLQESELTINQRRESMLDELTPLNTSTTPSITSTPTSLSPALSRSSADARTLHSTSSSRFGKHKQSSTPALDDFPPPPSSIHSSVASNDENAAPREGGRTSRFLKRMSNFGGSRRKNTSIQPAASSTSLASVASSTASAETVGASNSNININNNNNKTQNRASAPDTPPAVVVGDLNVQFPDSLLWKRRIVTIDDAGILQFAIASAMEVHKGVALKRYALADFCAPPYAPDVDSQELPHSVILEFHDGTTLQAACEDAMTQRQVLHLLRAYWKAWV